MTADKTLIDTVANAINEAGNDWLRSNPKAGWGDIPDKVFARAALQALLEAGPTEAMIAASGCECGLGGDGERTNDEYITRDFRAMLRAALEEADNHG